MDRYQIYESIGSSTHSIVYKARERKTIRFVAVCSTDKSQRQKVVHEVRTMARMQHENVARFFAWFETSNHLWTVTEYCAGGNLRELLQQDAVQPESTVGSFGVDLLAGMQHLHARGVLSSRAAPCAAGHRRSAAALGVARGVRGQQCAPARLLLPSLLAQRRAATLWCARPQCAHDGGRARGGRRGDGSLGCRVTSFPLVAFYTLYVTMALL